MKICYRGEEITFSCYKLLMRTDGKILYCQEHHFERNDKLPPRYIVKIGKRDIGIVMYLFAGNEEIAKDYAKIERLSRSQTGRWSLYIEKLKKYFFVECSEL